MYGRGAADMKSGVAAMIYALKAVHEAEVKLRGDVLIESVIDEECTGNGTLSCLAQGFRADAAVIPEPTHLSLVTAHPGVLWCRIRVRGLGAHAAWASTAVNAAEKVFVLIQALRELEAEWNRPQRRHPAFANRDHPLNFNVGTFHAGDWPSSTPELATVEVRLSYFPGENVEAVKRRIRECVMDASEKDEWLREHPPEISFFGFHAEPAVYDTGSEIARVVAANNECVTGRSTQARPFTATIDNRFFQLYFDIPTACYGPIGERLHAPDEWVDLESVRVCTQSLAGVLIDWCGLA
jgi:acetylornithine deacetylase